MLNDSLRLIENGWLEIDVSHLFKAGSSALLSNKSNWSVDFLSYIHARKFSLAQNIEKTIWLEK